MKIILIGPFPPPFGGVSVHIKRLYFVLKEKLDITIFCSTSNKIDFDNRIKIYTMKKIILRLLFFSSKKLYHFHDSNIKLLYILGIFNFFLRKKIIVTIHNNRFKKNYLNSKKIEQYLIKKFIRYINHIILVSDYSKSVFMDLNIKEENISVIPAYLNPIINEDDYKKIDIKVWNFISKRKEAGERIITGNGNIKFYNNEDLYGLDLLVELIYKLLQNNYKVSLVFALLGYEEQNKIERDYFEKLLERIENYKIEDKIFIYKVKDTEYYPILDKSDIFIRPTNTDGDAISLREAIYLKKPNISSDIVIRPKGTLVFKNRDINDLCYKTIYILDNYEEEVKKAEKIEVKEYYQEILEVYKKVDKGR